jgi:hypothetical protein
MKPKEAVMDMQDYNSPNSLIRRLVEPLFVAKGWLKFAGVMMIIQGVFTIFSIWGIIICWIPIWLGVILLSVAGHIERAYDTENEEEVNQSMEKLAKYFRINGIFMVVMLVVAVIGLVAAIAIPAFVTAMQAAKQM